MPNAPVYLNSNIVLVIGEVKLSRLSPTTARKGTGEWVAFTHRVPDSGSMQLLVVGYIYLMLYLGAA